MSSVRKPESRAGGSHPIPSSSENDGSAGGGREEELGAVATLAAYLATLTSRGLQEDAKKATILLVLHLLRELTGDDPTLTEITAALDQLMDASRDVCTVYCDWSLSLKTVHRYLERMVEEGLVERTPSVASKPYRLTEKGRSIVEKLKSIVSPSLLRALGELIATLRELHILAAGSTARP